MPFIACWIMYRQPNPRMLEMTKMDVQATSRREGAQVSILPGGTVWVAGPRGDPRCEVSNPVDRIRWNQLAAKRSNVKPAKLGIFETTVV